jgi:hypothetical protein
MVSSMKMLDTQGIRLTSEKNTIPTNPLVSEVPDINFYCAMLHIQSAEKLHAQTS